MRAERDVCWAARPASGCNGECGCARVDDVGRDEHTLTPEAGGLRVDLSLEFSGSGGSLTSRGA